MTFIARFWTFADIDVFSRKRELASLCSAKRAASFSTLQNPPQWTNCGAGEAQGGRNPKLASKLLWPAKYSMGKIRTDAGTDDGTEGRMTIAKTRNRAKEERKGNNSVS